MKHSEALESRRLLTAYFVSTTGSDASPGTDPSHPWRTITKLNATPFQPGDQVLFQSGQSFAGNLVFGASDQGTPTAPIVVNSYNFSQTAGLTLDGAPAVINAGNGSAIRATNTSGIQISDLNLIGSGQSPNSFSGISFDNNLAGNVQLPYVHIDSVSISNFGKFGITVGGSNGKSGFSDIRITNSIAFNNTVGGIETHGVFSGTATAYANSNVYLDHDTVHDNPGYAGASNHTGDGIILSDVNGGTIEQCEAFNNGAANTHVGGPVGIWAWDSNAVTIQHCESYANQTNSKADGGGFDLDGGDTNCTLQYNYSHDNAGAGFGLFQFAGARPFGNNVVRYNISQNDARKNGYGAITASGNSSTSLKSVDIYNNTIYVSSSGATSPKAVYLQSGTENVNIRNNIFQSVGGATLISITGTQTNLQFQGNDYWSSGSTFAISVPAKKGAIVYNSLAAWHNATGAETFNGVASGYQVDPLLKSAGGGGTIGINTTSSSLSTLTPYQLQATSPLIDKGINAEGFYTAPGSTDFYGASILDEGTQLFEIGAAEA